MKTEKPWGHEEILEQNDRYVLKKIFMKKGCKCSLQKHKTKIETIFVLLGRLRFYNANGTSVVMKVNKVMTIEPGRVHRMEAIRDSVYLEASTPELGDVVRIEDDYGRAG